MVLDPFVDIICWCWY